jgi:hypothetical protein
LQRAPLNPLCEEFYGAPHITIELADTGPLTVI